MKHSYAANLSMLINVAEENNRHLNITPLKTPRVEALPLEFMTRRNKTRSKEEVISRREIDLTPKTPINLVTANDYINFFIYIKYW